MLILILSIRSSQLEPDFKEAKGAMKALKRVLDKRKSKAGEKENEKSRADKAEKKRAGAVKAAKDQPLRSFGTLVGN